MVHRFAYGVGSKYYFYMSWTQQHLKVIQKKPLLTISKVRTGVLLSAKGDFVNQLSKAVQQGIAF